MIRRSTTALLGSLSLLALAMPARAAVETVIVTAEKRAEDVKNVPMSISVLGGDYLARTQSTSFQDFVTRVPGMSYSSADPTHTRLVLRGINAGGVGETLATYIDETPYGSSSALANGAITTPNLETFDMARIEILRGPQGTLYGAATLGGLLKFVTNEPSTDGWDDRFEVSANDLSHGDTGWSAKGMVNVPLGDGAALRVVGYHTSSGGFIDDPGRLLNNINEVRNNGGRATLLINLTDDVTLRVSAHLQDLEAGAHAVEDITTTGATFAPTFGAYKQQRIVNEFSTVNSRLYNATLDWNFDWATLTSATSYGTFRDNIITDTSGVFGGLIVDGHLKQGKFTQELRLTSPSDQTFEWLLGGYYTNETAGLHQDILIPPSTLTGLFVELDSHYVETAAFANLTYHISPAFDVDLGGRYSHNSQAANEFGLAVALGSSSANIFTWSGSARYHIDDDTMLYARVAKGWRPGGPNALPPFPPPGVPTFFAADSLINYELGVKSDLFDGAVSVDASVFLIDWSDIQLLVISGGFGVNSNGGTARSQGFEWKVDWRPIDDLTLGFSGAYTDAHLTSGTDPILVGAVSGQPLPWTPKWGTSLDGDYRFAAMGDVTPFVGLTWRYIGERFSDYGGFVVPPTPNQFALPSYNTIDARLGVDWNNWTIQLYGKNLGNSRGITDFGPTGASAASGLAGTAAVITPRELGIVLRGKI